MPCANFGEKELGIVLLFFVHLGGSACPTCTDNGFTLLVCV